MSTLNVKLDNTAGLRTSSNLQLVPGNNNNATPNSQRTWNFEDTISQVIEEIANDLNKKSEAAKWKSILVETNLFDTVGSLQVLNATDWVTMGLPLRVFTEIRRGIIQNNDNNVTLPKKDKKKFASANSEKSIPPAVPKRVGSKSPRGGNMVAAGGVAGGGGGSPFPDLVPFFASKQKRESGNIARIASSKKKSAKDKDSDKLIFKFNIISKDNLASSLLQQLNPDPASSPDIFTTHVSMYGQQISLEFYDALKTKSDVCHANIILFCKVNPIKSLSEVNEKVQGAFGQLKGLHTPMFLVAYDPEYKADLSSKKNWIKDFDEQIKPTRFFDIKTHDHLKDFISESALIALRNYDINANKVELLSKIQKIIDKKNPEASFRKYSLSIFPNLIFGLTPFVTRICIESNTFKYFPSEVLEFENLTDLNLNSNLLEEIPDDISKLKSLIKLDIDSNNLESLPLSSLNEMKTLQELKARMNPLSKVPEEISKSKGDILQCIRQYQSSLLNQPPPIPEIEKYKIFGVTLDELMSNETKVIPHAIIPRFIQFSINHIIKTGMEVEGIFRLAGQSVQMAQLKEDLDSGLRSFQDSEYVHNVTSLLKQWLRELPQPLFPFEYYEKIIALSEQSEEKQIEELKGMISGLPIINQQLLKVIFRVMYLVSLNSEVNRMDVGNVCKVICPNLTYPNIPKDPLETMTDINKVNDTLTFYVSNYPSIYEYGHNLFDDETLIQNKVAILYRKIYKHGKSVVGTVITSDIKYLWSGDSKGVLRLSTTNDLSHVKEIDTTKSRINCLKKCQDKLWVGFMNCIQIRNEISGDLIKEIETPATYNITTVQNNIWVGDAGKIIVYDGSTFVSEEIAANCLVLSLVEVNDEVWGACGDRKIRIWSIASKEMIDEFDCPQGKLNSVSYINGRVWSCADDSSICIWDRTTKEMVQKLDNKHTSKIFGAVHVGKHVWTYSWDGIHIYDAETFEYIGNVYSYHHDAIGSIEACFDNESGHYKVFTGSWDKSVICWLTQ